MNTNNLPETALSLGGFLRDRRGRLAPGPDAQSRRRTPGLRREEVAARACVSVTWYTWLEQGRGGPPSDEVLERLAPGLGPGAPRPGAPFPLPPPNPPRLARALGRDAPGREVLFLRAQQRPPPLTPVAPSAVPEALQKVLDSMPNSPA